MANKALDLIMFWNMRKTAFLPIRETVFESFSVLALSGKETEELFKQCNYSHKDADDHANYG